MNDKEKSYIELRNQIYEKEKNRNELKFDKDYGSEQVKKTIDREKYEDFNVDDDDVDTNGELKKLKKLQDELDDLFKKIQDYTPGDDFQERKNDIDDFNQKNNEFKEKYTNFIDEVYANFVKEKKEQEKEDNRLKLQENLTEVITNIIQKKLNDEKLRIMEENIQKAKDEKERRTREEELKKEKKLQQEEEFKYKKTKHIENLNELIERYKNIIKTCEGIENSINEKNLHSFRFNYMLFCTNIYIRSLLNWK